jgi:hypothetical protein
MLLWRGTADASLANGSLAKTATSSAVYFIWQGERYAFPNEKIYYSWYQDFLGVKTISSTEMAGYRLRGNVTYKPSGRLVKLSSDPKVYAVSKCGVLHGIATEAAATQTFGTGWRTLVDDLSDAFFINYSVSADINTSADYAVDTTTKTIDQNLCTTSTTNTNSNTNTAQTVNTNVNANVNTNTNTNIPANTNVPLTGTNTPTSIVGGSVGIASIVTPTSGPSKVGNCQIYPSDNPWNTDISGNAVHAMNSSWSQTFQQDFTKTHNAFDNPVGSRVTSAQPKVIIQCTPGVKYCQKSAMYQNGVPRPMPIPDDAEIENLNVTTGNYSGIGSDRHVWVVDTDACILYELFHAHRIKDSDGTPIYTNDVTQLQGISWHWQADSAGVYDFKTNAPSHVAKTPTDTASGMPMFVGLAKYEEMAAAIASDPINGTINHALAFSIPRTQAAYIAPATNYSSMGANPTNPAYPPMGARLRLKASYDISQLYGQARILANTMKKYGLFVTDNGKAVLYPNGSTGPTSAWAYWPDLIQQLNAIPSSAYEFVETGPILY